MDTWLRRLNQRLPSSLRELVPPGDNGSPDVNLKSTDFSGAELRKADFSGAELRKADFSGAELRKADFSGAYLFEADFSGAELWGANLSDAELRKADLSGAELWDANLSDANLFEADLSGAELWDTNLSDTDLIDADLSGANLSRATLKGTNLRNADLSGAGFMEADLSGADLSVAKLTGADLLGADLSGTTLVQATLNDATFGAKRRIEGEFAGWYIQRRLEIVAWLLGLPAVGRVPDENIGPTSETPSRTKLIEANLRGADLSQVDLSYTDFDGADLRKAIVTDTVLTESKFDETDFGFTDLSGESFRDVKFSGAKMEKVDFSRADLVDTKFAGADLRGAVFDNAECRRCVFDGADLERASFIGCDLRAATFAGSNVYLANFGECRLDPDTTIQEVYSYAEPPPSVPRMLMERVRNSYARVWEGSTDTDQSDDRSGVDEPSEPEPSVEESVSAHDGESERTGDLDEGGSIGNGIGTGDSPPNDLDRSEEAPSDPESDESTAEPGADDRSEQRGEIGWRRTHDGDGDSSDEEASEHTPGEVYERAAWTYRTIHRLLTRHGRTREALDERYYLKGQWARIKQADADRNPFRLVRALVVYLLTLTSERLWSVMMAILVVTTAFTVVYSLPVVGGATTATGGTVGPVSLFLFSLVTLFEGTHSIVSEAVPFGIVQELDPLFAVGLEAFEANGLEPATDAGARIAVIQRSLGVLLIVPFTLLFVQRLRLYARAATTEGTGGVTSWLSGK